MATDRVVAGCATAFDGELYRPGAPGYDASRTGFDLAHVSSPAICVAATSRHDLVEGVRLANALQRPVAVQATGHGPTVPADDAVLIDTSRLTAVTVDLERRAARMQAGATWTDVIRATAPHGLAPLVGSAPAVGAVSYTLGGGLGPLGRRFGFAADHVRSLDLVTADARTLEVSDEHEPDLFWAVRGAGRNFGVVTELEVSLFPIAHLYGGGMFFPGEQADTVIGTFLQLITDAPDELSLSLALVHLPPLAALPPEIRGRYCCIVRVAHSGAPTDVEELINRLRRSGEVLLDTVRTMPFADVGTISADPTQPAPVSSHSTVLGTVDEAFLGRLLDVLDATTPFMTEIRHLGGALTRQPDPENAVGQRHGYLNLFTSAYPSHFPAVEEQEALYAALDRYSTGGTLANWLTGPRITPDAVRASYGPEIWPRLVQLKQFWDRDNIFRYNQNIQPT